MACTDDADAASAALLAAAVGPAKVSGDAGTVETHRIDHLLAVEQYLRSRCATSTSPRRVLRFIQLVPPGAP